MKRLLNLYCCVTVMVMMMFTACEQEQNASTNVSIEDVVSTTTTTVKGEESTVTTVQNASLLANQYFWGTWVKMSDGAEYVINETDCRYSSISNTFSSSTDTTLTVSGLGTFTKQSDSVMVMDNIPYYRKGGANLEYSIRVVGFTDGRAGGTYGQANKRVTGKSQKYTSYTSETQTNSDGMAKLIAPTANDFQTVTVENDNGVSVSVSDICVERSGANMGTIALVNAEQPNLKVTGTIDEYYKDDGYMYIGIPYPMTLTIKNISSNMMKTSIITITSADDTLTVTGNTKFQMSSLAYGGTRTETLSLNCGDINDGYIDTGLKISIENILDGVTWEDFVPLRFHRKKTHFSFSAECPDNNSGASLKGYIIYPDGNSQYFTVADKGIKTIYVPEFCADEPYLMVFCGALANTGTVSTEMFYTVARSNMSIPIDISTIDKQRDAIRFGDYGGEKNDTEDTALSVTQAFQAYLSANDIDYYKMYLNVITHTVLLDNDDGTDSQSLVTLDIGDVLPTIAVPSREGYVFGGYWSEQNGSGVQYIDNNGYNVMLIDKSVTTLYAKWTPITYTVVYNPNGGSGDPQSQSMIYGESTVLRQNDFTLTGKNFIGWSLSTSSSTVAYNDMDVVSNLTSTAGATVTLYAVWGDNKVVNLDAQGATTTGTKVLSVGKDVSVSAVTVPQKTGYVFGGYWTEPNGIGTMYINVYGNSVINNMYDAVYSGMTLYAKWSSSGNIIIGKLEYEKTSFVKVTDTEVTITCDQTGGVFPTARGSVTIAPYSIGKYEVTQQLYTAVMGSNPSNFKSDTALGTGETNYLLRPVEHVSWYDTIVFCNKLSTLMGKTRCYKLSDGTYPEEYGSIPTTYDNMLWNNSTCDWNADGYRLPTECEWELAARGGIYSAGTPWTYIYSGSNIWDDVAWYLDNSDNHTREVGLKDPNSLGLYDMNGNVYEWCWDYYNTIDSSTP
ncbi:MAG: SUMF1/EgtB/PvdO family nonheme iron enzyme, partial [Spirochaetales bacterium]|nr:SUMF1/EgtB/PvdO family nonheme iron enzyme [Spirochaetales bacterium]